MTGTAPKETEVKKEKDERKRKISEVMDRVRAHALVKKTKHTIVKPGARPFHLETKEAAE
jgi:hypothetical protein